MNRIVVFGATGNTGLCALNSAVNKGLNVRAFVRDTEKVPANIRDKVETIVGDVTNAEQVSKAVSNRDAVVVVLGTRNDLSKRYFLCKRQAFNRGSHNFIFNAFRFYYRAVSGHEKYNRRYESA